MKSENVYRTRIIAALSVALAGCTHDVAESTDSTAPEEVTAEASRALTGPYQFPYAGMAWHQGNKDGFAPSQVAGLSSGYVYNSVIIPKMHRENLGEDYYASLAWERDNSTWWSSQCYVLGYFNAHYYCPRYAITGHTVSNFSTAGGNGVCNRTWSANSAAAHNYVDAALAKIQASGANGVYIDFPWSGSGLGVLAGYIITKATQMFGYNVVVNTNSKATGTLIEAKAADIWTAHIEKAGPDFFDGSSAGESTRADEKTQALVNSTITYLWNNNPQVFQVQPTSIACDPTAAYTTSTTTGNWQYLNYYQANACAGINCVYMCINGFSCTGNTDETLVCGGGG
jgi:hypothetical protein